MDLLDKRVGAGFALGLGVGIIAATLSASAAGAGRSLFKTAVKGGILLSERFQELIAHMREAAEDAAAEAHAELEHRHETEAQAVAEGAPTEH